MTIGNLKCVKCENLKRENQFYASSSPLHNGKVPYCKSCIRKLIDIEKLESVKNVLRMMDKPYIEFLWNSSLDESNRTKKDLFGIYMKNIGMHQYRDLTWKDSIHDYVQTNDNNEFEEKSNDHFNVTEEIIERWGEGYTTEEYKQFEKKYNKLIRNYTEKTSLHTEGLFTYIRFRVKEEMATAKGLVKEAKEWASLASKAAIDAKINVSQLSKSDISGGVDVLSQLFEAVETELGIIPLLPKVTAQPYDDADLIIWAIINYYRRLEDKPNVLYKDIYAFYDDMLKEHFDSKGFDQEQIEQYLVQRNNVFRDLENVYIEPLYETGDE